MNWKIVDSIFEDLGMRDSYERKYCRIWKAKVKKTESEQGIVSFVITSQEKKTGWPETLSKDVYLGTETITERIQNVM